MQWHYGIVALLGAMATAACGSSSDTDTSTGSGDGPTSSGVGAMGGSGGAAGHGGGSGGASAPNCDTADQCQSGYCVDGVCCDAACDGVCVGCHEAGAVGVCSASEAGSNEANECGGGVCDGAGQCAQGEVSWSDGFADVDAAAGSANSQGIDTDASGNIYVTGFYRGSIKMGNTVLTSDSGSADIFVAKFTPTGQALWARSLGGPLDDYASSLALAPNGNIIIGCSLRGGADVGAAAPLQTVPASNSDGVVLRLNDDGDYLGHTTLAGAGVNRILDVAVGVGGAIVIAGDHDGAATLFTTPLALNSGRHGFVARLSPNGQPLWVTSLYRTTPGERSVGLAVSITGDGNVIATGSYSPGGKGTDVYLGSFSLLGGNNNWERHFGDTGQDKGQSVAAAAGGSFWAVGYFTKEIDFGNAANPACKMVSTGYDDTSAKTIDTTKGYRDIYVVEFDAGGSAGFCASYGAYNAAMAGGTIPHQDTAHAVTVDTQGNVIMSGRYRNSVDFGGGERTSIGSTFDMVVLKLSANGTYLWDMACGSDGQDQAYAATTDSSDNIVIAGNYGGASNCPGATWPVPTATTAPFLMKIAP